MDCRQMMTFQEWRDSVLHDVANYYTDDDPRWDPPGLLHIRGADDDESLVNLGPLMNGIAQKDMLADVLLPVLIARFKAKYAALILNAWYMDVGEMPRKLTPNEQAQVERVIRMGGIDTLPRHLRKESCIIHASYGQATDDMWDATILRDPRRGTWLEEWRHFSARPGYGGASGRFPGALRRAFHLAANVTPEQMEAVAKLTGYAILDQAEFMGAHAQQRRRTNAHKN